ncbi:MAG: MBOAT family protein [Lachnospiraceae bacterium]|nr:MBOAT family protein [Lachnospiraceae bacterium]
MVFSSTIFIFFFLPLVLAGYFLAPSIKVKNVWLLLASLFFYFFGGSVFFPIIIYSIVLNYAGGRVIGYLQITGKEKAQKFFFVLTVGLNLLNLGYWKYAKFFMQIVNDITGLKLAIPDIILPIGISFFTFQGMSYVIDVYRKDAQVQKNILKIGLYISLFPQLIAGPIVRYADIEKQLNDRKHSVDEFAAGIRVFTVGLAKKAIIANSTAITADAVFGMHPYQNTPAVAWLGLFTYTLQLYFDFSGYSDMAIGLGRMFGFRFPKNFDYPFISCSATELWRRWHISLSTWFRDYVYIPLGGSRKGNVYFHLMCVFVLTGLWHGAAWNYVLWGFYWAVIIVIERFVTRQLQFKPMVPKFFKWCYAMFLWMMSMVIFRTETLQSSFQYFQSLFGLAPLQNVGFSLDYYINKYEIFIIILGTAAMLPAGKKCYESLKVKMPETGFILLENVATLLLFGVSILYVVTGTYNPFIYFQF